MIPLEKVDGVAGCPCRATGCQPIMICVNIRIEYYTLRWLPKISDNTQRRAESEVSC